MPEPTTWELIKEFSNDASIVVVLAAIIYLFVSGKIVAKAARDYTIRKLRNNLEEIDDE